MTGAVVLAMDTHWPSSCFWNPSTQLQFVGRSQTPLTQIKLGICWQIQFVVSMHFSMNSLDSSCSESKSLVTMLTSSDSENDSRTGSTCFSNTSSITSSISSASPSANSSKPSNASSNFASDRIPVGSMHKSSMQILSSQSEQTLIEGCASVQLNMLPISYPVNSSHIVV